ncbi:MAG: Ig-like domain-containing protein [Gemmatimonadaceae bacterium]|nr:Ig-like domain-containing protein [Gemmatimonadaceae bacterium]
MIASALTRWLRRRAIPLAWLGVVACSGDGPTPPPSVARIELSTTMLALRVGGSQPVQARALDARGNVLPGVAVAWQSSDATVAGVSASGVVTAVGAGQAVISASAGTTTAIIAVDVALVPVSRIVFSGSVAELLLGRQSTFRITALDSLGAEAAGWTRTWSTDDPSIATVDATGRVTALRAGSTTIRVRVDTLTASQTLRVAGALDLAVTGLSFVQVVQNDSNTVPIIRNGGLPVAVNVYLTADAAIAPDAWVRVRCGEGAAVRWEDSARVDAALPSIATGDAPAAQLVMPNARLTPTFQCHAEVDAEQLVPDTLRANNRFPRTGASPVITLDVPPLEVTFVPVVLAGDGGTIGNVTAANLDQYLITARQLLPLGRINARVGQPFTTNTVFANGGDAAWRSMLRELEGKRVVDGFRGHYYGVVRPGAGVTNVTFGGFGFISGWTALSIQVGWFNREPQARETVAHELGHNFGRPHAPCGNPAGPDPLFPYVDAQIGAHGWDVYSGALAGGRVRAIGGDARDLMSYCRPIWISDYTYRRMIAGRQALAGALAVPAGPALLVRGELGRNEALIDPLFRLESVPTPQPRPPAAESIVIEVIDARGVVVGTQRAALLQPDHGGPPSFVAVVPVNAGNEALRVRVAARGLTAERRIDAGGAPVVRMERDQRGTHVRWDAREASHVLVRDGSTGELLAFGQGGRLDLPAAPRRLQLAFSNGGSTSVVR